MKRIIFILTVFFLVSACTKLEDLNVNTKDPAKVSGESIFTNAQKRLVDQMVNTNVNNNIFRLLVQQWTETTYTDESNYDLQTRSIPDDHWDILYENVLANLKEATKVITNTTYAVTENSSVKKNKLLIIDILTAYTFSVLVETFGNVPYSEALDITKPLPKYDDGLTIYKDLISRLTTDISTLDDAHGSFDAADNIYHGDVAEWKKFANSLKLRMGLILADVDPAIAKAAVESAATNVITSNTDNAKMIYQGAIPNTNPLYVDLVASGRYDFVVSNTFVDSLNSFNDPRRQYYMTQVDTSSVAGVIKKAYVGGVNGGSNNYGSYSHIADKIQQPTFEAIIFDFSEVEFLLAEAVARGYNVGGDTATHYNNAIKASIEYWKGSTATVEATAYLANPKVAYATATGTWKQKIGIQSWFALYNRGFEAWSQYRKLDFPVLVPNADNATSALPLRFTYPIEEQTLNGANYKAAGAAIGGDAVDTKLFWDKN
jgi:hypothetical protein